MFIYERWATAALWGANCDCPQEKEWWLPRQRLFSLALVLFSSFSADWQHQYGDLSLHNAQLNWDSYSTPTQIDWMNQCITRNLHTSPKTSKLSCSLLPTKTTSLLSWNLKSDLECRTSVKQCSRFSRMLRTKHTNKQKNKTYRAQKYWVKQLIVY